MKNDIIISIKKVHKISIIKKLIKYKMEYNFIREDNNSVYIRISKENYLKLKKLFFKKDLNVIKEYGIKGLTNYLKKNMIIICSIIISLLLLYYLTNLTFSIEVISKNEELVNSLIEELETYGIKKYSFKKSYKELSKIKKSILNNNEKKLEWIELKYDGTKLIIEFTERVINEKEKDSKIYNIIAKKDALITKIVVKNGVLKKEINDYVKKGEIIISSDVINNSEEIVKRISADGSIYGEVWYTVSTTVPYEYVEYFNTGKSFDNIYLIFLGHKLVLTGAYNIKNVLVSKKVLIDKPYLSFKLINEKKEIYNYKTVRITPSQVQEEAIKRSTKAIENKLNIDEYIIDKKVLKINNFSSKINIEMFFRVYENIKDMMLVE